MQYLYRSTVNRENTAIKSQSHPKDGNVNFMLGGP